VKEKERRTQNVGTFIQACAEFSRLQTRPPHEQWVCLGDDELTVRPEPTDVSYYDLSLAPGLTERYARLLLSMIHGITD